MLLLGLTGCKKFLNINTDPNDPVTVPEAQILAPVEASVANNIVGGNTSLLVNEWMQNVAQNQAIPNFDTYQITTNNFSGYWTDFYVTTLNNLYLLDQEAVTDGNSTYSGIAKVLFAFTLQNATDLWGDVPDSKAFQGSAVLTPPYDSQDTVYMHLQTLLDSAIAELARAGGKQPGGDDYFYGGDAGEWTKAAYLMKARCYMHLTHAPGYSASAQAGLALSALQNAMGSNADDMAFPYTGSSTAQCPIYQNYGTTSISTLVLSTTLVDSLVNRNDPRLAQLVEPAPNTGLYTGRPDGDPVFGVLLDYSVPGPFYGSAGSSLYILNYTEALFLKAEATLIQSGPAAATPIYRLGIATHCQKLGLDTTSAAVQQYLAQRGVLNATNGWEWLMEEKGIANYFSLENYVDFRRTGYPALTIVPNAVTSVIPNRFQYPLTEITSNPQPQQSAKITDKLWWQGN